MRTISMRVLAAAVLTAMLLSLATGCNVAKYGNGTLKTQNVGNTEKVLKNGQHYSNDGYLGMSNTFPNTPGRHMGMNYAADSDRMRYAIRNLPGVMGSNVTLNGADAYVTIHLRPGQSPRVIPSIEQQAASVLRFNFPSYIIHVRSLPAGR